MEEKKIIGSRIKTLRTKRAITADALGNAIGKDRATIYRYESGKINIPYSVLVKIANALNTSVEYLRGVTDNDKITLGNILETSGIYSTMHDAFVRIFDSGSGITQDDLYGLTERELETIKKLIFNVQYLSDNNLDAIDIMIDGFASTSKKDINKEWINNNN